MSFVWKGVFVVLILVIFVLNVDTAFPFFFEHMKRNLRSAPALVDLNDASLEPSPIGPFERTRDREMLNQLQRSPFTYTSFNARGKWREFGAYNAFFEGVPRRESTKNVFADCLKRPSGWWRRLSFVVAAKSKDLLRNNLLSSCVYKREGSRKDHEWLIFNVSDQRHSFSLAEVYQVNVYSKTRCLLLLTVSSARP